MPRAMRIASALLVPFSFACARAEPPSPASASATTAGMPSGAAPVRPNAEALGPRDGASVDARTDASAPAERDASSSDAAAADAAVAVDPATLPQTRDEPKGSGAAWDARVAALWSAIVDDDPDRALPFFFPVRAYEQVKAIAEPARDWKRRLVAAYARDIHELHRRLGADPHNAHLVALELGPAPRWVEPGEEYNKIGYYRVFGSKLRWTRDEWDNRSETFDVKSLISWRGEWYVVHLSAIK